MDSNESKEVFNAAIEHFLVDSGDGIFLEVLGLAVGGEGLLVGVLFVNQDGFGIALKLMGNIRDTSGLLARGGGEQAQAFRDFGAIFLMELEADDKADHESTFSFG